MRIGIVGAGHIGGTLTRRLTKLGHEVKVANSRGPVTLQILAEETGAKPVTVHDAVRDVDLIIVTIPEKYIPDLPKGLFADVPEHVPVVDTGNYYPNNRDGYIKEIEEGMPESKWVAEQLGRPVIKAFNTIWYKNLLEKGRPKGDPNRLALPVAGDNEEHKKKVMELIDELGFDPVDAGSLDESWRQQPGTPCYVKELTADKLREALQKANPDRPDDFRYQG